MNDSTLIKDFEDIEQCAKAGRKPRDKGPYRIKIGDKDLNFKPFIIEDPVPTGRQILDLAKLRPAEGYILFQILKDGLLEEIRLEETTDLRERGVEKFLAFRNDRSFRFILDGRQFEWGAELISGLTLKKLAEVDPAKYGVWLKVHGAEDKIIGNDELVNLSEPGVERFFTGDTQTTEG